jgi:hypothetical protein
MLPKYPPAPVPVLPPPPNAELAFVGDHLDGAYDLVVAVVAPTLQVAYEDNAAAAVVVEVDRPRRSYWYKYQYW